MSRTCAYRCVLAFDEWRKPIRYLRDFQTTSIARIEHCCIDGSNRVLSKQPFNRSLLPFGRSFASYVQYSSALYTEHVVIVYGLPIFLLHHQSVLFRELTRRTQGNHARFTSLALSPQAFGLAVVICSWWLHLKSADYGALLANRWLTAPAIVIVSGREWPNDLVLDVQFDHWLAKLAILLGIVGCLGAWFEKKAILLLVIDHAQRVTIEIPFVILAFSTFLLWSFSSSDCYWALSSPSRSMSK